MSSIKRLIERPGIVSAVFYIGCVVLAAAMWEFTQHINNLPYVTEIVDPEALGKAQDSYGAVNNLLITLASGLLAGLGLFVTSGSKKQYAGREFWPAAISALCASISLYWGYISAQNLEWAIEVSIGSLDLEKIQLPRELQFLTLVLSVFFFAEFVRRDLTEVD
jgi:hypothetical protein